MSAYYYPTALFDNCVPQRQLISCSVTNPFLSAKGVACEISNSQAIRCTTSAMIMFFVLISHPQLTDYSAQ